MRPPRSKAALALLDVLVWELTEAARPSTLADLSGLPLGTVQPLLARLERLEWVTSAWDDAEPADTGRPRRRIYVLTAVGDSRARRALDEAIGRLDRQDTDPLPNETWPTARLDDHLLAAVVRLLPMPVRQRYDEELGGEFAASRHPLGDAMSVLGNVIQLRRAVAVERLHQPLRCRLGRHLDLQVHTDVANHRAYFLRCRRCGRERNPGQDPAFGSSNRRGWASITAA